MSTETTEALELHVVLRGSEPPIWRRLLIATDATLADLHAALQCVMGWNDAHLHAFRIGGVTYGVPSADDWAEVTDEATVTLADVLPPRGGSLLYEYDFGDGWEHEVTVGPAVVAATRAELPVCVAGERACPPEDCGGIDGYADLLEALADPDHPDHGELAAWCGPFDPENVDLDAVNARLRARAPA